MLCTSSRLCVLLNSCESLHFRKPLIDEILTTKNNEKKTNSEFTQQEKIKRSLQYESDKQARRFAIKNSLFAIKQKITKFRASVKKNIQRDSQKKLSYRDNDSQDTQNKKLRHVVSG